VKKLFKMLLLTYLLAAMPARVMAESQEVLIHKIKKQLAEFKSLSGNFRQNRFVKSADLNLESKGSFSFNLTSELVWHQRTPFIQDLTMTKEAITQKGPDGTGSTISKEQQPQLFGFSNVLLSIFAGDVKVLKDNFEYTVTLEKKRWNMKLVAKDQLFKKLISEINVAGDKFINSITVLEKSGNELKIYFSDIKGK